MCCFSEEELRKLREETNVEKIKEELERERGKRIDLELRMNEVLKSRCVCDGKSEGNQMCVVSFSKCCLLREHLVSHVTLRLSVLPSVLQPSTPCLPSCLPQ